MFLLLVEALQKLEKVLINPKLPKFKAKKTKFQRFSAKHHAGEKFSATFCPCVALKCLSLGKKVSEISSKKRFWILKNFSSQNVTNVAGSKILEM